MKPRGPPLLEQPQVSATHLVMGAPVLSRTPAPCARARWLCTRPWSSVPQRKPSAHVQPPCGCPVSSSPVLTPSVCPQLREAYGHKQGPSPGPTHPGRQRREEWEEKMYTLNRGALWKITTKKSPLIISGKHFNSGHDMKGPMEDIYLKMRQT